MYNNLESLPGYGTNVDQTLYWSFNRAQHASMTDDTRDVKLTRLAC